MLFNTFSFALVFLPLALLGYFLLSKLSMRLSIAFLLAASIVFYIQWDVAYLPLILGSFTVNYGFGRWISRDQEAGKAARAKVGLILGLAFNLVLLGIFKYLDFLVSNLAWLTGAALSPPGIVLPLGISFFTFTQIAYLVDCHASGVREYRLENYGLFVTYFPHLIAGPILHHRDVMPQFEHAASRPFVPGRLVIGTAFFVIGLIKKVVLADGLARFVAPVFDVHHAQLTSLEAWSGALAYTFQLYFDFSAYSDMAYGLSYMFGIVLPINFNSPYKARSIVDFWRRWHITLSWFLRNYLYIPLGGNRHGSAKRYRNLMFTMLLGGLWHGANWTFVVWGGLHGVYLVLNHALRKVLGGRENAIIGCAGWLATFLAVVVGWVFFRAGSLPVAIDVLRAMAGGGGSLAALGAGAGINRIMPVDQCMAWLLAASCIAFFAPNAYQILGHGLQFAKENRLNSHRGAAALAVLSVLALLVIALGTARGQSPFLYFNF